MKNKKTNSASYFKFFAMIVTAMVAMFFLMYTNSYQIFDHAWFSEERLFMTMVMGGSMMIIMLAFMLQMYKSSKMNIAIFIGGALLLFGSIWLSRSQTTIDDVDYMEGMIPHHSIAILTSERASFKDRRVQKLAKAIMDAQRIEIKEMEWLIYDIRDNGIAETKVDAELRPVPKFAPTPE